MRALQLTAWKSRPELREVPEPEPGPGKVVVRIAAAGACHSDLHLMHDFDAGVVPYALPFTLGHENTGIVEAVGAGVEHFAPGEPVAVYGSWGCGDAAVAIRARRTIASGRPSSGAPGEGLASTGAWPR